MDLIQHIYYDKYSIHFTIIHKESIVCYESQIHLNYQKNYFNLFELYTKALLRAIFIFQYFE